MPGVKSKQHKHTRNPTVQETPKAPASSTELNADDVTLRAFLGEPATIGNGIHPSMSLPPLETQPMDPTAEDRPENAENDTPVVHSTTCPQSEEMISTCATTTPVQGTAHKHHSDKTGSTLVPPVQTTHETLSEAEHHGAVEKDRNAFLSAGVSQQAAASKQDSNHEARLASRPSTQSLKTSVRSSGSLNAVSAVPELLPTQTRIVCREWQTECPRTLNPSIPTLNLNKALSANSSPPSLPNPPRTVKDAKPKRQGRRSETQAPPPQTTLSTIPEKDAVIWQIKDFNAFWTASKVSHIPPLTSPDFGGGCRLRLRLFDKKGHITGWIEIPLTKALRQGVAHFEVTVLKPDLRVITRRKIEVCVTFPTGDGPKARAQQKLSDRQSKSFHLTKSRTFRSPKFDHLIVDDTLRLRVDVQYFPFDAPVFRGLGPADKPFGQCETAVSATRSYAEGRQGTLDLTTETYKTELLQDIQDYCAEDLSQNVEIRREGTTFTVSRFLLCARSTRFREIFGINGIGGGNSMQQIPSGRRTPCTPQTPFNIGKDGLPSITLQGVDVDTLQELLHFITWDSCRSLDDYTTDILKVLDLFETAVFYGVKALVKRLLHHLEHRLNTENFAFMFEVAERSNNEEFKRICSEFLDSIPGSQVASLMRATAIASGPIETPRIISSAR